jgi:hypothetical protein
VSDVLAYGGVGTALLLATRIAAPALKELVLVAKNGNGNGKGDRDDMRAQERTLLIVSAIQDAVSSGNREHVAELHGVRMAIEQAAAALTRVAERVDEHHTAALPAITAALETKQIVGEVKSMVERRRRK